MPFLPHRHDYEDLPVGRHGHQETMDRIMQLHLPAHRWQTCAVASMMNGVNSRIVSQECCEARFTTMRRNSIVKLEGVA